MIDKNNEKSGFTLIELIIVIAIIAILSAVALPRLSGYVDTAKESTYINTADVVYKGITAFMAATPDFETNYQKYTTTDKFDYGDGLTYLKPEYIEPFLQGIPEVTDDEMAYLYDGYVRIEYCAKRTNEEYDFEIQIGGANKDSADGKEYGRFYYNKKQ